MEPMEFSLLETMRLDEGTIVRLERHLSRLAASSRQFGYAHDEARIRSAVADTVRAHPRGQWRVRLLVARDGTPTIECTPYTPRRSRLARDVRRRSRRFQRSVPREQDDQSQRSTTRRVRPGLTWTM